MPISKRVVKALAELGKALEEEGLASSGDEWEKVSDVSPKASSEKKGYTHVAPSVCTGEAVEEKRPRSHQQLPVAPGFFWQGHGLTRGLSQKISGATWCWRTPTIRLAWVSGAGHLHKHGAR